MSTNTDTCGLLSLPAELRCRVFSELVNASKVRYDKGEGYSGYRFHPNIFQVNRQIHSEAVETFQHENTFVLVSTPFMEAEEHVADRSVTLTPVFKALSYEMIEHH